MNTIEQANEYLANDYLAWWEREMTVEATSPDDAHRPLEKSHHLAASLSHVETRQVRNDYTLQFEGKLYQIERQTIMSGLRGATVRVEKRLDGEMAVRHGETYVTVNVRAPAEKKAVVQKRANQPRPQPRRGSDWNKNFDLKNAPKIWQVLQDSDRGQGKED